MQKKALLSLATGLLVSSAALYFAFRNVPVDALSAYFSTINYFWVLPSVIIVISSFLLRVFRWQIILGSTRKVGFLSAYHPLMIGFMLNLILPGRAGEIARPAILYKKERFSFPAGLATVAAERLFDLVMLIVLFAAVLSTVEIDPALQIRFGDYTLNREMLDSIGAGMLKLCLVLIIFVFTVSFNRTRNSIISLIMTLPAIFFFAPASFKNMIRQYISKPLSGIVEKIASGFSLVKDPLKIVICLGLSFLIWFLQAFSFYIVAQGCPGIDLSLVQQFVVLVIVCLFIALPSVPGFWGLWEAGGIFALSLFGITESDAAGYTLANHAIQIFPILVLGLFSAFVTGVKINSQFKT